MFGRVRHLHFMGIGGAGMCGLAELLHREGLSVTGCDLANSETTARLEALGIPVAVGHSPDHAREADVIVISSAVPRDTAEVKAAVERGVPVIRRAEMLGEVSRLRWAVAVAGTHGKTTTTSLTGFILTHAGLDPTVVVGGRVHFLAAHARVGRSRFMVCEADEYDRSFLEIYPVLAIVTTMEAEHLDCYGSLEAMEEAFATFVNRVPFYGAVIGCLDNPGVRRLLPGCRRRVITYGESPQADVHARGLRLTPEGAHCTVVADGEELGDLFVPMPGRHSLANALAAVAAAREAGVSFPVIAEAVAAFSGVARRFEVRGERNGVTVVDDYAHHHTELTATLQAARQRFPGARIAIVFQPHLFSRTQRFARELGEALLGADLAFVLPIYPSRETAIPGVTHELVVEAARRSGHRAVTAAASFADAHKQLEAATAPGDVIITAGAGNVFALADQFLAGEAP